ncbi:MAG: fumarylacetoacetate hydrolase family protein [Pigmentiphaga sp.]|uniref:fumarylacetoacetate hydrolase family protein n=1 Tax=Pigmentiphaga sp. TaxID=1977564 RepID=UPI0029B6C185|nr:fumarylacetoacetate hydrolase family protein [Pigmentiphaga sp.]MDX3905124.1 fumarylacetoacetate hydrolase family protein [Pigmentiphaga sp.]
MKLVRFDSAQGARLGVLDNEGSVVDIAATCAASGGLSEAERTVLSDVNAFIASAASGQALARRALAAGSSRVVVPSARLLAPLTPGIILATGGNYADHLDEIADLASTGKDPAFFFKTPRAVIGPDAGIELDPRLTRKLDYEIELAVVIGKPGRWIREEDAAAHIYGYTILNDVTLRDRQITFQGGVAVIELGGSKNFATSCPVGPVVVTADDIPDPQRLTLRTTVNGELRQNNSTALMIAGVYRLVSFFSQFLMLQPGDVITTGTPGGTAWAGDEELGGKPYTRNDIVRAARYLEVGDVVKGEIEGIGVLSNPVVPAP